MNLAASAVVLDLAANAIRLVVPGLSARARDASVTGVLDVGANGRLLGIELGGDYVTVMDPPPGSEAFVRSATVTVGVSGTEPVELSLPWHGRDYEITYPSGNQCWQVTTQDGRLIQLCATSVDEPAASRDGDAAPSGTAE